MAGGNRAKSEEGEKHPAGAIEQGEKYGTDQETSTARSNAPVRMSASVDRSRKRSVRIRSERYSRGSSVFDNGTQRQYLGVRFTVPTTSIANEIGGEIRGISPSGTFGTTGNNQIWGAIVQLSGTSDFPDSASPLNSSDVLATTLITLASSFTDTSAPIGPVTLQPGVNYGLFFGTNQFGATGRGAAYGGTTAAAKTVHGENTSSGAF